MDFSGRILDDLENFCVSFVMDDTTLTFEESEAIQAQADKLHQAITRLAAQVNGIGGA